MKKYKLANEKKRINGHVVHRIEYLHDSIRGGWIESEKNLSQKGACVVTEDAVVYGDAVVRDNAIVCGTAIVKDKSVVCGSAYVGGSAIIKDNARVSENAVVSAFARVLKNVNISGNAAISGNAVISDSAIVTGNARVFDNAAVVDGAYVTDCATVSDNASIHGSAHVGGHGHITGEATILGDAIVLDKNDYILLKNNWSSGRYFTWTRSNDMWAVGCFYGTAEQLIRKAYTEDKYKGRCYEASVDYVNRLCAIRKEYKTEAYPEHKNIIRTILQKIKNYFSR